MSELVFVYGTLRPGGSAAAKMERASHLGEAKLYGKLYDMGWYPGLRLDPLAGEVVGDLFAVPEMLLPVLDGYEGCAVSDPAPHEYERLLTTVVTADGAICEAWTYQICRDVTGQPEIVPADWLAWCKQQEKTS